MNLKLFFVLLSITIVSASCKKNGTGGQANIVAFPKHHDKPIKGATLFIKFGTKAQPSDPQNDYDLKIDGLSREDHVHANGMLYGTYYLYAVGFDSSIMMPVKGGIAVKVRRSERTKEVDVDVPVTE